MRKIIYSKILCMALMPSMGLAAELILSAAASDPVYQGTLHPVSVTYEASQTREILIFFQLNSSPWTTYSTKRTTVNAGTGTIDVSGITFQNHGTVSPGVSPGGLTFSGNYLHSASGQVDVELDGLTAISEYDRLAISGTATAIPIPMMETTTRISGSVNPRRPDAVLPTPPCIASRMLDGAGPADRHLRRLEIRAPYFTNGHSPLPRR